jgi:hypothetical protein
LWRRISVRIEEIRLGGLGGHRLAFEIRAGDKIGAGRGRREAIAFDRETATAMRFEDRVTAVSFACSARLLDVPKDQHGGLNDAGDGLAIGHHARELPDHDIGDGLVGAELELGGDLLLALAIGRLQPGVA